MTRIEINRHHTVIPVTIEQAADAADTAAAIQSWRSATPEQREVWAREVAAQRAAERAAATPVPLTLDALLDRLGWTHEYAAHVVQPYCGCGDDIDGWTRCEHARDLDLEP